MLEFLLLERLESVFQEANVPHPNQSAYKKKVSCADAILATQEVILRYLKSGNKVVMCLYDLQKSFDSVEYPVLLEKLFDVGVNGEGGSFSTGGSTYSISATMERWSDVFRSSISRVQQSVMRDVASTSANI